MGPDLRTNARNFSSFEQQKDHSFVFNLLETFNLYIVFILVRQRNCFSLFHIYSNKSEKEEK